MKGPERQARAIDTVRIYPDTSEGDDARVNDFLDNNKDR